MLTQHKGALFILAAALVYAGFSSPTPDAPGIAEGLILLLLCGSLLCVRNITQALWTAPFLTILAYGATVPLFIGALNGHTGGDIIRDLIAFLVLAVPIAFGSFYPSQDNRAQFYLLLTLLSVGMIFALRYLVASADMFASFGTASINGDLLYLANSPLVAFSASWLLLHGCFGERQFKYAIIFVILSLIPIAAMVGMMQRATLGLLAFAWVGFFGLTIIKRPLHALHLMLGVVAFSLLLWPLPEVAVLSLADKTWAVGWNARGAELLTLLDALRDNPITTIFGAGWGSLVKSPAVGEVWVRFSHSFVTSMLWKAGWVGLILSITAIGLLIATRLKHIRKNPEMGVSLLLAALPSLFLYGSYKSLCFGLLLLGLGYLNWTRSQPKC